MPSEKLKQTRNKYDVDETLDSPFSFKHFSRSVKYIKRHAKELVSALIFSVIAIVSGLTFPYILMIITDHADSCGKYMGHCCGRRNRVCADSDYYVLRTQARPNQ